MQTNNIPRGTVQITLTNGIQYLAMGLFYISVTKTNALTQTDIGALSILSFLSSTIVLLTSLALPTALTKFTSEKLGKNQLEEAASVQKTVTKIVLTLSAIGFITALFFSHQLSQLFLGSQIYTPLVTLMLIHTFLFTITALCNSTLQALYLFGKMAAVTLTSVIVSRTTAAALAVLHMGLTGVLIGYIAGACTALTLALTFIHGRLPKPAHNTPIKPLLKFSLPLLVSSLTLLVLNWADILIVTAATQDYSQTGIYHITVKSVSALSILWIPVTTTIFPALSAKHGLRRPQGITDILKTSSRYLLYLTIPSCLGLAAISSTALDFFYGPDYTAGAFSLSILSITTIITALYSLLTTGLTALGKTTQILKINIILTLSTLAALPLLVPLLQILGAALTRLTTRLIAVTLAFYLLRKEVKVEMDKEALWKSTLASTATLPLLLALEATITQNLTTTQTLAIEILAAIALYAVILHLLKALKHQDFELLRQALPQPLTKYINLIERLII